MQLPQFLTNPDPEIYLGGNYVVLDFETTTIGKGLPVYPANRVVLAAWRLGPSHPNRHGAGAYSHRHRRAGEFELQDLVEAVHRAAFIVAHNAKFELGWLARCGVNLEEVLCYDTLIGEYVLGGNRWTYKDLGLEKLGQKYLGEGKTSVVSRMIKSGVPVEDIPEEWLERYCSQDVSLTERIFLKQRRLLLTSGLLPVLYSRCLLTPILADIASNGVCLDPELLYNKTREVEQQYAESQRKLETQAGGINLNSGPQLGKLLYEDLGFEERMERKNGKWVPVRTATNRPAVDAETILCLVPNNKKQRDFLDAYTGYKEVYNELTKYLRKFEDCCRDSGGILLAELNQTSTRTHRLSSNGLDYSTQFQNFPRSYKPLFRSRHPGWLVGECDGAQLEFRVAVHQGHDPVGLLDIVRGTDIHTNTANVIGVSRQEAKAHTFKPLYGGQSGTEAERRYYQYFRERYRGISDTQRKWVDEVLARKQLRTEWGLIYYWPDTRITRSGYITNTPSICNYPVQALATAEIIPIALVWFWHRLKRSGLRMFIVNTIHDSIICELPPEEEQAFRDLSKQCLTVDVYKTVKDLYGIEFTVPLGAGIKVASHWGTGEEEKHSAPEELWRPAAEKEGMIS